MKKKFDFLMLITTTLFAACGIGIVGGIHSWNDSDTAMAGLVTAILFFTVPVLTGYAGLRLALLLQRSRYVCKVSSGGKTLIVALLISAVVGGIGQLLYAIEWQTYTTETVIETQMKGSHVVMLMDISGSMKNEKASCVEAACQLIDGLDDTTSMQFIAFAGAVKDEYVSDFAQLTAEHKTSLQNLIRSTGMVGGTNFNQPLDMAIETITKNQMQDYRNIIIMLTDGSATVKDSVKNALANSDIQLFTVRITDSSGDSDPDVQALIQMAAQDFPVVPSADSGMDVSVILESFRAALNASRVITEEHQKLGLGSDLVFTVNLESFWWRPVVQILVFSIFSVMISLAYYGNLSKGSMVLSLMAGILCGIVLVAMAEWYALVLLILCFGAYTIFEIEEVPANV